MPSPPAAPEVLNREFLEIRAKILEVAAALDRLDRAEGFLDGDPRMAKLRQALAVLSTGGGDRAEQVQMIFSLPYDDGWRERFALARK
ncbi:MAG TPA: hypothetical protein VGX78_06975 [Pirellulales bacterium]|jgi:hypothetical protein|nr:hypothetical protein [Pirellulales bacterium]